MSIFSKISLRRPKLNKFDLSHERKMSLNMGKLVPIFCGDVIPGDKFRVNSEIMMRYAPMLAPIMHRVNVFTHYFFVPNRLVWNEWEDFITGGRLGTSAPIAPYMKYDTTGYSNGIWQAGTLADYLGIPQVPSEEMDTELKISALPFRAYQLIFNEFYRDQNLMAPIEFSKASGWTSYADDIILGTIRNRCWEKDPFTSALPWAQRGGEVSTPLEGTADVTYKNISEIYRASDGAEPDATGDIGVDIDDPSVRLKASANAAARIENIDEINVDSAGFSINDLRRAVRLQEWLEKNARGGARYIEQILSHFGVVSSDARLQRPQYLGGGKAPTVISEVLSTVDSTDPLGTMGGHGIAIGNMNGFNKRFEEHGYIIGIMSVLPRTAYQQGVPRHFLRESKLDYAWPEFAHLGEQEVYDCEVFLNELATNHKTTFGYNSRYCEYKYMPSLVSGDMKSSLSYWHMGRIFTAPPALNQSFVESDPTLRIFAVTDPEIHHLYCQVYNNVSALRPLPYFGTPTL